MRLQGRKASINIISVVFPREGADPVVFKASAIMDGEEFDKLVPDPTPPLLRKVGEDTASPDYSDTKYLKAKMKKSELQTYWLIIKSLEATAGLVWDKVNIEDPTTWKNIDAELIEFGLSSIERQKLVQAVMRANSLDSRFIEEAKERFILSQQAAKVEPMSSQVAVPLNTKSGEPVKQ